MGQVKDYDLYLKLGNVANNTFGTEGPGSFITNGNKIKVDVLDDRTLRFVFRKIIYYSSRSMLSALTSNLTKEALDSAKRVAKELEDRIGDSKVTVREELAHNHIEQLENNTYRPDQSAYFRWFVLVDVESTKKKED